MNLDQAAQRAAERTTTETIAVAVIIRDDGIHAVYTTGSLITLVL